MIGEDRRTPAGSTLKRVPARTSAQARRLRTLLRTEGQGEPDPQRDEYAVEVPVGDDNDVAGALALLEPQPMVLADLERT